MQRIVTLALVLAVGFLGGLLTERRAASARGGAAATRNGDVNGDGGIDLSDAVSLINWLFLSGPEPLPIDCAPAPPGVPATGLASCYDAAGLTVECAGPDCSGQDGFYRLGCPANERFADNGDGTVSDRCTGLSWQKESSPEMYTWCEALQFCEGLDLARHSDWRLPNLKELLSIVDYGRTDLAVDPMFPTLPEGHWTSTSQSTYPESAWCVIFGFGTSEWVEKGTGLRLRAVRGGK